MIAPNLPILKDTGLGGRSGSHLVLKRRPKICCPVPGRTRRARQQQRNVQVNTARTVKETAATTGKRRVESCRQGRIPASAMVELLVSIGSRSPAQSRS